MIKGVLLICFCIAWPCAGAQVLQSTVTPDGMLRIEVADYSTLTKFELWSTNTSNGVRKKIGGIVAADYDVSEFILSIDGSRVAYRQGRTATGEWVLYSGLTSMPGAVIISQPMVPGGSVMPGLRLLSGDRVRYQADAERDEQYLYWVVPIVGGRILRELFADGFEGGATGGWR